jgi:hypothetical protein
MDILIRVQFTGPGSEQHMDAFLIFNHGADRAAIHHDIRREGVRYVLSLYPVFDSIWDKRVRLKRL